jgi:hypothetical protein
MTLTIALASAAAIPFLLMFLIALFKDAHQRTAPRALYVVERSIEPPQPAANDTRQKSSAVGCAA